MITRIPLLSATPCTEHYLQIYRYGILGARPKIYLQAALHANEYPPLLVVQHLQSLLDQAQARGDITGEIIVVPIANPLGLNQHLLGHLIGRYDMAYGINFNREFPDLTALVWAEVETHLNSDVSHNVACIRAALRMVIDRLTPQRPADVLKMTLLRQSIDADIVLDLHCDQCALLHLYAATYAADLGEELGALLAAEAILLEENSGGQAFDESNMLVWRKLAGLTACPIPQACAAMTVELRGGQDVSDAYAARDAEHLFEFLQRRGAIRGDVAALPALRCSATLLEFTDVLQMPMAGLVLYRKQLGDWVEEGEVVAEIVTLQANYARYPLVSNTTGRLFTHASERFLPAGAKVCKIAGSKPLKYREKGRLLVD